MTTGQLIAAPVLRVYDNSNNLAISGSVYTYVAGTSTPIQTFTDSTCTTPNTNPIILNSRGECAIWVIPNQSYKLVAYDASSNLLFTRDNISANGAFSSSDGSSLVGYINGNTGAVARTVQSRLRDFVSITDFGAVGSPTNDNAAFVLAEACAAKDIYIPEGSWICNNNTNLHKNYYGPGKLTDVAGNIMPGNYAQRTTALSPVPTEGYIGYFDGDTSQSRQLYNILQNVKSGLTFPYYCAQTTPVFEIFSNYAGSSGATCLVATAITAGDVSCVLNSTDGLSIGTVVGFVNVSGAVTDTFTIAAISSGPPAISFGGLTFSHSYPVGTQVTPTLRTMTPSHHYEVNNTGAGDSYALLMRLTANYVPKAGQTHFYYTSTTGFGGGDIDATQPGNYLTGWELQFNDNGNDTAVIGSVMNYNRTNNTAAKYQVWIDHYVQNYGTKAIDAGYVLTGTARCGVDLSQGDFSTNGNNAIGLGTNQRIYWGNTKSSHPTGIPNQLWGDTNSTNWDDWTGAARRFVVANTAVMSIGSTGVLTTGTLGASGNIGSTAGVFTVGANQVVGPRITGYGTPTGGATVSSFPGATATLAQTSAQLAQLILDLKTHGLLGS